jgi:hypothetical protein
MWSTLWTKVVLVTFIVFATIILLFLVFPLHNKGEKSLLFWDESMKGKAEVPNLTMHFNHNFLPFARRQAKHMKGFEHPQLIILDVSRAFVDLALNAVSSLKKLGIDKILLVLGFDGVCANGWPKEASFSVPCVDMKWFVDQKVGFSSERGDKDMASFLTLRYFLIWQLLKNDIGITLMDSDMVFFQNIFDLPFGKAFDMTFATNLGRCDTAHAFLKTRIPPNLGYTRHCLTPIPPWVTQPVKAGVEFWERAFNSQVVHHYQGIEAIADMFQGMVYADFPTSIFSLELALRDGLRVSAFNCNVSFSECDEILPPHLECWRDGSGMYSYHANCANGMNDVKWKHMALVRKRAWFV